MLIDSPPPASQAAIAAAILSASTFSRLAIAAPDARLRERGAEDLAREIIERLASDASQLTLAL